MSFGAPPPLSKRLFDKYDKDNSGHISDSEFRQLCQDKGHYLSDEEFAVAMQVLDKDGNKKITYDEFKQWWADNDRFEKLKLSEEELENMARASAYFKYFDQDNSGSIDAKEFKGLHADLVKNGLTKYDLEKCLQDLDTNRDNTISFNEYIDWLVRIGSLKVKVLQ